MRLPYPDHIFRSQLALVMSKAINFVATPLCEHVLDIILIRSQEQMRWVHAWRIVAAMQDI